MTKYREILRLKSLGFSERNIAHSCGVSRNTVAKVIKRAAEINLSWPLAYAAPTVQPDRRRWCIVTAGMVHGDRRCGAPGRHAENYSGMPLRLRMDSPSIWMV